MRDYRLEALSHDPVHGYIAFTTDEGLPAGEASERELIDNPWLQRLRQIHQLQTAWWVFPSAEHTRFQHVLGAMHLAGRAAAALYSSLKESCGGEAPSQGYVECLLRLAALLHDVGHGPFGHFLDEHLLSHYGLTHETLGSHIIRHELAGTLRRIRRAPSAQLADGEQIDPEQIAFLITRPRPEMLSEQPRWLLHLRALFSGLYTVDNMDFVLRDAYMSGYNTRAFDLERLLHYTFFTEQGLTIHVRGLPALVRFLTVRAELFRTVYFHRTVRALDKSLEDLFVASRRHLFPGNPLEHLEAYQQFTEWSLLIDVARWPASDAPERRELGERWAAFLRRELRWRMAAERTVFYDPQSAEQGSIFSRADLFEAALRAQLPEALKQVPLRVDVPRHMHRPGTRGPAAGQNFVYDPAVGAARDLNTSELVRRLPTSWRICRVYTEHGQHDTAMAAALDRLVGPSSLDDPTNM